MVSPPIPILWNTKLPCDPLEFKAKLSSVPRSYKDSNYRPIEVPFSAGWAGFRGCESICSRSGILWRGVSLAEAVRRSCSDEEEMTVQVTETALAEFEKYAAAYSELLDDPVRNRFTRDPLHFHLRKWIVMERLLKKRGLNPQTLTWLDVGCGRGELLALAGDKFGRAIGCDPSYGMLPSDPPFKVYEQPCLTELPFKDQSVDFVTMVCVLHHVLGANRQILMKEIRRVLSPGGLCCIFEHNPWNPVTRMIVKRCPVDISAELQPAFATRRLLQICGFTSVQTEYFLYLPEPVFQKFAATEMLLSRLPLGGQYAVLAQPTPFSVDYVGGDSGCRF